MTNEFFPVRSDISPTIYAYEDTHPQYKGQLKIGYTTIDAATRVAQQYPTIRPGQKPYRIVLEESAMRKDGTTFSDHDIHKVLRARGFKNTAGEWFECSTKDVRSAILAVRNNEEIAPSRDQDFEMRPEQRAAVERTARYYHSFYQDKKDIDNKVPRFLWNAKMRFGKTFTSYQLAKKLKWKKILVLTFKPAVQSAWEEDLSRHIDFSGWQFIKRDGDITYDNANKEMQ